MTDRKKAFWTYRGCLKVLLSSSIPLSASYPHCQRCNFPQKCYQSRGPFYWAKRRESVIDTGRKIGCQSTQYLVSNTLATCVVVYKEKLCDRNFLFESDNQGSWECFITTLKKRGLWMSEFITPCCSLRTKSLSLKAPVLIRSTQWLVCRLSSFLLFLLHSLR